MGTVVIIDQQTILKNKGFPVEFYVLETDADGNPVRTKNPVNPYKRMQNEEGDDRVERVWFKFTNSQLAAFEAPQPLGWGSLDDWEEQVSNANVFDVAKTIAITLDLYVSDKDGNVVPDNQLALAKMVDGALSEYLVAINAAMRIAQGHDPQQMRDFLVEGLKAVKSDADMKTTLEVGMLREALKKAEEAKEKMPEIISEGVGILLGAEEESSTPTNQTDDIPGDSGSLPGLQLEEALTSSGS